MPGDEPGRLARLAVDVRPLRDSPPFRRLWFGEAVSYVGNMITFVAVPYQLYQLTHSTLQVGLLSLADAVPLLALAMVGGAIADAVDRRRLALVTEVGLALVSGLLAVNATLGHPRVWALYVLAALGTSFWSLGAPALRALMPGLVAPDQITAASALESVYGNFGAVAGPALGGVLIAAGGLTTTYVVDLATFGASMLAIWSLAPVPPAPGAERASLRSILDGLRFLRSRPVVLGTFLIDSNAMIFGMPTALFPAIALHRFHGGARVVGLLYAAPSAGALAAMLVSGWIGSVRRQGLGVAAAAAAWGLALAVFGFATALWFGLAMLALAGAADAISATLRSTILLTATPDHLRGRLRGIELAQVASTPALGNLEAGVVASLTSLRFSVVSGGLACVAGCGLLLLAIPQLLRYDARAAA